MSLALIRVAVCDDQKIELLILDRLLKEYRGGRQQCDLRVQCFCGGELLLEALKKGARFDLFLLDVMMPGVDGIALGHQIHSHLMGSSIIYITASDQYALEAFRVRAAHYLMKPIDPKELYAALDEVIGERFVHAMAGERFQIKTRAGVVHIPVESIVHVENAGRAVRMFLTDGSMVESVTLQKSFEDQVESLLCQPGFVHTHKSYVANIQRAVRLTDGELYMMTGAQIPVSRRYYPTVSSAFLAISQPEETDAGILKAEPEPIIPGIS